MKHLRFGLWLYGITVMITLIVLSGTAQPATAQTTVAPDGAVGINASWEAGKSSAWYIEEQRCGVDYIQSGIAREEPTLIEQGLTIFDWGFSHQSADGSFPGTADGKVGPAFQSVSLFIESVARAMLMLRQYHPSTYTLSPTYYAATLTSYKIHLNAACHWMMQPTVAAVGQQGNLPYAHRCWLLAAALGETAALTGDSAVGAAALPYVRDGLSRQLPTGWRAALIRNSDGTFPPAVLLGPGQDPPYGAFAVVGAAGVNPEKGGYDINYQAFGLFLASHYEPLCPDATLRNQMKTMIMQGLSWEAQWVDGRGTISSLGSSRVGVELNHDGTVKQIASGTISQAFQDGGQLIPSQLCLVVANRLDEGGDTPNSTPVAGDGAVGANADWESGKAQSWNVGLQAAGADWVQYGVALENDAMIREGVQVLNWGFAHQAADGSFAGTSSSFYTTAQFVEAAARVAQLLQQYHPVTYTADAAFYAHVVSAYSAHLLGAAGWLMRPDISSAGKLHDGAYSSRLYTVAAALAETGQLNKSTAVLAAAAPYVYQAFSLQLSNGANTEAGLTDINRQAYGLLNAERCALNEPDATLRAQMAAVICLGLAWQSQWVTSEGTVIGTLSPSRAILQSFLQAGSLTGDARFTVIANRLQHV